MTISLTQTFRGYFAVDSIAEMGIPKSSERVTLSILLENGQPDPSRGQVAFVITDPEYFGVFKHGSVFRVVFEPMPALRSSQTSQTPAPASTVPTLVAVPGKEE